MQGLHVTKRFCYATRRFLSHMKLLKRKREEEEG